MNFDEWEYRESELPKDDKAQKAYLEKLRTKFLQEVQNSEAVQKWLQQFDDKTWERFLNHYAKYKVDIVSYSKQFVARAERVPELKDRPFTQKTLAMLLQKKLFDTQCRWRAELLTLPGIRITHDFWYWAKNIFNCPFLDPVTDTELEILQRYVQTDDFDPEHLHTTSYGWQMPELVKRHRQDEMDDDVVAWYDYYDMYMGTSMLKLLPDIRGEKEKTYTDAVEQKEAAEKEPAKEDTIPYVYVPPKESLYFSVQHFYEMACVFDDDYFITLLKAKSEEDAIGDGLEAKEAEVNRYTYLLKNIAEPPPVRAGLSWRMALKYCYIDYIKDFITHDLPAVCEEYQLYRSMNLFYTPDDKDDEEKKLEDFAISNHQIKDILEGRALLGEPQDLNF